MTQLILTIIIGIGIAAVAAGGALTLFQSARDVVDQQLLWARLEQTAAALRAKTLILDGVPILPMAETTTDSYPAVPTWVTANGIDTNGNRFVYCPFAVRSTSVEGTSTTVTGPGYSVVTYSSAITGSREYVVGVRRPALAGTTAAAPQGLLGVLISFKPKDTYSSTVAVNWCNNLTVSATGAITASFSSQTGIVYPIVAPQAPVQQVFAKRDAVVFYVKATATGDRTGRNLDNATTLNAAFAQLAALRPHRAKLYLSAESHTLSSITKQDASGNDVYNRGNLRQKIYDIEGAGSGATTVTLNLTGDYDLPVNMIWRGVTVSATDTEKLVVPPNTKTIIENAVINNLFIKQGTAWVRGTSALNTSVVVTDVGRLVINGTVTSSVADQSDSNSAPSGILLRPGRMDILPGASWEITATSAASTPSAPVVVFGGGILSNSGSMTVTSNGSTRLKSAINVVPGGTINMNNATLTLNSGNSTIAGDGSSRAGAIVLGGDMFMVASGILFPGGTASSVAGVVLVDGGRFFMHAGSYIGSSGNASERPQIGIYDNGGTQVGGSSAGCGAITETADGNTSCNTGDGGSVLSHVYAASGGKCWDGNGDPYSTGIVAANKRHLFIDSNEGNGLYSSPKDTCNGNTNGTCGAGAVANLLTYTDSLRPDWTTIGTTSTLLATGVSAPDGSSTAITVNSTRNTSVGISTYYKYNKALTMTGQHTGSIYIKTDVPGDVGKQVNLWSNNGTTRNATAVTLTGSWQRVTMNNSYSFPGASVSLPFNVGLLSSSSGGSTVLSATYSIWGAQLESGTSATTYSPVGAASALQVTDYRHLRLANNTDWQCHR